MQAFARVSFLDGFLEGPTRTKGVRVGCRAASRAMRGSLHSNAITATRAELFSLWKKQRFGLQKGVGNDGMYDFNHCLLLSCYFNKLNGLLSCKGASARRRPS